MHNIYIYYKQIFFNIFVYFIKLLPKCHLNTQKAFDCIAHVFLSRMQCIFFPKSTTSNTSFPSGSATARLVSKR